MGLDHGMIGIPMQYGSQAWDSRVAMTNLYVYIGDDENMHLLPAYTRTGAMCHQHFLTFGGIFIFPREFSMCCLELLAYRLACLHHPPPL